MFSLGLVSYLAKLVLNHFNEVMFGSNNSGKLGRSKVATLVRLMY